MTPPPVAQDRAWRAAALAAVALACWLSLTPVPPKPPGLPTRADLAAHLAMHAGLAFTLARGFPVVGPAVSAAMALYLEAAQLAAPGRQFALSDLAANALGVVVGLRAVGLWRRRLARRGPLR